MVVRKAADSLHLYVKKRTLKPGKTLKLLYYFPPSGVQETVSFTSAMEARINLVLSKL